MDKLTDLEICKRIAEIEGVQLRESGAWWKSPSGSCRPSMYEYNPLIDDSLCFQLMVKYEIPPMRNEVTGLFECVYDMNVALSGAGIIENESPNKTICLAIIEMHKNGLS